MRSSISPLVLLAVAGTVSACARPAPAPLLIDASSVIDRRDGTTYPVVRIGPQRWIPQNMRFNTPGSRCYDDRNDVCARLGRLYTWAAALVACPVGFHLASDVDWQELELSAGMSALDVFKADARGDGVGDRLKAMGNTGFNAELGGWFDPNTLQFRRADTSSAIWTSTEADAVWAWHRDVGNLRSSIWRSTVPKSFLLSARCVENKPAPRR